MEIIDVVMRLNGRVDPVGESHTDAGRLENLHSLCDLAGLLLDRIEAVAEAADDHMASVKAAKNVAAEFLRTRGVMAPDVGAALSLAEIGLANAASYEGRALPARELDSVKAALKSVRAALGVMGKGRPCSHCDAPPGHWHTFSCPVREQSAPGVMAAETQQKGGT